MIIAIDGPSGAGKSSVSQVVAKELGFSCLDTGAMYRSVAWKACDLGVDLEDAEAVTNVAKSYEIEFVHEPGEPNAKAVLIGGTDVTKVIRTAEIDKAVTPVSSIPAVREALVAQQQRIGAAADYVVEGRDIGTVVFPNAELKIFLTASDEERARRRVKQNIERGVGSTDFEEVLADIIRRDKADSSRAASPLKPAEDSVLVDSTNLSMEEVVDVICVIARRRQG